MQRYRDAVQFGWKLFPQKSLAASSTGTEVRNYDILTAHVTCNTATQHAALTACHYVMATYRLFHGISFNFTLL